MPKQNDRHPFRRYMPPAEVQAMREAIERKRQESQDRKARYARGAEALNRHFDR